jgi:hypothetical protein
MTRTIAPVIHRRRLGDDDAPRRRAYWRSRSIEERILEVEALRRMWIERLGDPDRPIARVVTRRPLR